MKKISIGSTLTLPCGEVLSNRIAKSAMSENLADRGHKPSIKFYNLYKKWVEGETGLLISGNIMVDHLFLGEPNNLVIDKDVNNFQEFKQFARCTQNSKSKLWVQLNHPGKQIPKFLCKEPVAPSALPLKSPLDKVFNCPKALTGIEIKNIINRFAYASKFVKDTGFHGVQIHGAHGYLVSQFLSPIHNQRNDKWGGILENRMRFVIEIYKAIRKEVGEKFPIGIKLNSADFQKGGFSHEDSVLVAEELSNLGIDLIEVSGGSYEKPIMMGTEKESTVKREAYFLEYAADIKEKIKCPLMVTGGFRSSSFIKKTIESEKVDMVGLARTLVLNPNFSKEVISEKESISLVKPLTTGFSTLDKIFPLEIIWYTNQIHRIANNKKIKNDYSVFSVIIKSIISTGFQSLKKLRF